MTTRRLIHGRLLLRLNAQSETPALVVVQCLGRTIASGTYWCVTQEGFDEIELTASEQQWITEMEPIVDSFCEEKLK